MTSGNQSQQLLQNEQVEIGWCPVDDIPQLQAFIDKQWSQGHILSRDTDLLRWQCSHPTDPQLTYFIIAQSEGSIVGMLGLIPFDFSVKGKRLPSAWLTMWMAAPEWRDRLVGLRMMLKSLDGTHSFVGTTGANDTVMQMYPTLGFNTWHRLPRWIKVMSEASLKSLISDQTLPDNSGDKISPSESANSGNEDSPYQIIEWNDESAKRWDIAWNERFAARLIAAWKDSEYLRWRYVNHPRFNYELRFVESILDRSIVGLLVYKIETVRDRNEKVMRLSEFLTDENAGTTLARWVVETGVAANAAFADFYCTSSEIAKPLEDAGFLPEEQMPITFPILFQPLDNSVTRITGAFWTTPELALESPGLFEDPLFYVTRGDCDQDRPN